MHKIRLPSPIDPADVPAFKSEYPSAELRHENHLIYAYFATKRQQAEAMAFLCALKYGALQNDARKLALNT